VVRRYVHDVRTKRRKARSPVAVHREVVHDPEEPRLGTGRPTSLGRSYETRERLADDVVGLARIEPEAPAERPQLRRPQLVEALCLAMARHGPFVDVHDRHAAQGLHTLYDG
jgi:hypothetical protein